jgi:chromatin remodeling complex protein RSC6
MTSQEEPNEKAKEDQNKKAIDKKLEELRRKQIEENTKKFDNKLMKYFGNEFFERRLEIPPKRSPFDALEIDEELDKIIPKNKILRHLIQFDKKIDEKIFKTRLDIQEQILRPKNMIKATLRTHVFAYSKDDQSSDETNFYMNIQGRIINNNKNEIIDNKYRKFSHYFQKIVIKFEDNLYPDIEWENPNYPKYNSMSNININNSNNININNSINNNYQQGNNNNFNNNNNMNQINTNNLNNINNNNNSNYNINNKKEKDTDYDGLCIKRPAKEENMKIKILFYLSYHIQEFVLNPKLSELLGITQGTRPQILYHLWQYIKLNSLQDNENPKIVINNKQLSKIFGCEKLDISSLTSRLTEHLKTPPPLELDFNIHDLNEDYSKNQILKDIEITIDDPYCNNLLGFLSNANEESLLFPKRFFTSANSSMSGQANNFEKYLGKINDIEKQYATFMSIMKRHKYYYDFFDAYEKDPILFIDNFMIQQNELIKRINDQATSIARADYNSSQYYKDYEEVVRDYVDRYLAKKRQAPPQTNK